MKKIFGRAAEAQPDAPSTVRSAPAPKAARAVEVQLTPAELVLPGGGKGHLKVDVATTAGGFVAVAGWRAGDLQVGLRIDGIAVKCDLACVPRPDVNKHFGIETGKDLGFVLTVATSAADAVVELEWFDRAGATLGSTPLAVEAADDALGSDATDLAATRGLLARHFVPFSPQWRKAVKVPALPQPVASARGFLEGAVAISGTSHVAVCGWVATEAGGTAWLEDDDGNAYSLADACWRERHDVYQSVGGELGGGALNSGFVVHLQVATTTRRIRLKAITSDGVYLLADTACAALPPEPLAVSRWLFGIQVQEGKFWQRFDRVSEPLVAALIERSQAAWADLPVITRSIGRPPATPKVSIVVPLYSRYDFVESQMLEWARDPWIRNHAELIYVVDDPTIAEPFRTHAEELHRLYSVPFTWIWGGANRGFSGANNLGAASAKGQYLLFLNSDVFPQQPGWLQPLVAVLESDEGVGAVGPRLIFAEGGIQHAGMRFERMEEYDVWTNRHPYLGLDPALDPHTALTVVPAVTGACLLLRRRDFDAVGGWDTGYLIGDFEDSDLCLKLREHGLQITYLPQVQLTHLERQSFGAIGAGDYRQRVTLWNALRHQNRWSHLLEPATATEAAR